MSTDRELEAFDRCVGLTGAARQAALDEVSGGDAAFRERVERLLAAHDRSERFSTLGFLATALEDVTPDRIGPYRLVARLGAGGMGEVWVGEQDEPVRRKVAIKLIKAGMDTRDVLARFGLERQALALMNHPCIARIYDAGSTASGRPYFVMEHVEGVPITEWCDQHQLGIADRLALMLDVCDAVQHAHQKGVIHRDLKPSNILVAEEDGRTRVKVIDFGIAKAVDEDVPTPRGSPATRIGDVLGTPDYMSPEQASAAAQGLDTRTDVYALGVVLYELVCGCRPLDLERAGGDLAEVRRVIRDEVPPPPSARFGDDGGEARAALRRGTAAALRHQVRSELDWITQRALEKERERRYQTVNALRDDLTRFLADEPVVARPPELRYRLAKYARKHRGLIVGAATVLVGIAVTAGGFAFRLAEERDLARLEAERAESMAEFLLGLFDSTDVNSVAWAEVDLGAARRILDRGVERIDDQLAAQPEVRAELLGKIGEVYVGFGDASLGDLEKGRRLLMQAVAMRRDRFGDGDLQAARYTTFIALSHHKEGRYAESIALLEPNLALLRAGAGAGSYAHAISAMQLAMDLRATNEFGPAQASIEEAIAVLERAPAGADAGDLPSAIDILAGIHRLAGRPDQAIAEYRKALAILDRSPSLRGRSLLHPQMLNNLAVALPAEDPESHALLRESLVIGEAILGPDDGRLAINYRNLASRLRRSGKTAEALEQSTKGLRLARAMLRADHPELTVYLEQHALVLLAAGDVVEAERIAREAWRTVAARSGATRADFAKTGIVLAAVELERGKVRDAERLLLEAAEVFAPVAGSTPTAANKARYRDASQRLADLYRRAGDLAAAAKWAERAAAK